MCVYCGIYIYMRGTFIYYGYSVIPRYIICIAISLLQRLWSAPPSRWSLYYFNPQNAFRSRRETFVLSAAAPKDVLAIETTDRFGVTRGNIFCYLSFKISSRRLSSGLLRDDRNNIIANRLSSSSRPYSLPVYFATCRAILFHYTFFVFL